MGGQYRFGWVIRVYCLVRVWGTGGGTVGTWRWEEIDWLVRLGSARGDGWMSELE